MHAYGLVQHAVQWCSGAVVQWARWDQEGRRAVQSLEL